jgi:cell division protein FtsZ
LPLSRFVAARQRAEGHVSEPDSGQHIPAIHRSFRLAAQGQLDSQGRVPAPTRSFEDDQLEIPAFLRRQAK